jgi:hypothetical protein
MAIEVILNFKLLRPRWEKVAGCKQLHLIKESQEAFGGAIMETIVSCKRGWELVVTLTKEEKVPNYIHAMVS